MSRTPAAAFGWPAVNTPTKSEPRGHNLRWRATWSAFSQETSELRRGDLSPDCAVLRVRRAVTYRGGVNRCEHDRPACRQDRHVPQSP